MLDYEHIASHFTGWTLSELRRLPVRERKYWNQVATKRIRAKGGTYVSGG